MQLDPVGIAVADLADSLATHDVLPFRDQNARIVRIGGQQRFAVADDDEFSIAPQPGTGIDDRPEAAAWTSMPRGPAMSSPLLRPSP